MTISKLRSSKDYFDQVLKPNYLAFANSPSTFQLVYNTAAPLFHMHEWVFNLDKAKAEAALGVTFQKKSDVWSEVRNAVPNAGFIRDIANSSKHVALTHSSTSMTHSANTFIVDSTLSGGATLSGTLRLSTPNVVAIEGEPAISFDACAAGVYNFWEGLVRQL
ncbi:hypothetical protein [Bradyrhizobium sp. DASA03120]|uniref:hypothetical protein n=1 Tax=Bradyrhizobium sp. SMVTL-02 TaxID=3395917 RepID=UPI003F72BF1B